MNKITLISFAGRPDLDISQEKLRKQAKAAQIEHFIPYSEIDFKNTMFCKENQQIFKHARGFGFWLWKPWLIFKTLFEIPENDIVMYCDVGNAIMPKIKSLILAFIERNNDFFLIMDDHSHSTYCKRDCFVLMDCDKIEYWKSKQINEGLLAFKKNIKTIAFVEEWLKYSLNYNIISDEPSRINNFKNFRDHRHTQAIITNLVIKYNIPTVGIKETWGALRCNVQ